MTDSERANLAVWDGSTRKRYEVWFLKLNHRATGAGLWLRYTFLSPAEGRGEPVAEVWGIFFDTRDPKRNLAIKQTFPAPQATIGRGPFAIRIGESALTNASASGLLRRAESEIRWDLRWDPNPEAFEPFPYAFMYRAPIPKTKFNSPNLDIRFRGTFTVNGETYACEEEPGQQAHLWGTKSADQWAWAHCNAFEENGGTVFEGLSAKIRIGPIRTPNLTILHLQSEGEPYTFNSLFQMLMSKSIPGLERWSFSGENERFRLHGTITARLQDFVGVKYVDPDGEPLYCHNTKVASCELALEEPTGGAWYPIEKFVSRGTTAFEWVSRRPDPRVEIRI
jgi:hypothetical protein